MNRLTIQQVDPIDRGASARKKSGHMQRGVHRAEAISQLFSQNPGLQHPMTAQSRIAPADQQKLLITDSLCGEGLLKRGNNLTIAFRRGLRRKCTGIGQHEKKW